MRKPPKIRTRYQRMQLACLLAETLKTHPDPQVQCRALEIEYALASPMSTLNHVIDQFPRDIVAYVMKTPDASSGLVEHVRAIRREKATATDI
jgi:hypothetical protein